jgi:hypothetical protein
MSVAGVGRLLSPMFWPGFFIVAGDRPAITAAFGRMSVFGGIQQRLSFIAKTVA